MSNSSQMDAQSSESSASRELDDLNSLNFPSDIDWSSTVVLRCDPSGGPYSLSDVLTGLHNVVRRNEVFNLGATALNHAFTLSFKSSLSLENFIRYLKSPKMSDGLTVKGHTCLFSRVPVKCVTVMVRWIPLEVDTAHIVEVLKEYGTIVKTEWIRSNFRGWFHVYTNERKFTLLLKSHLTPENLPFGIEVKGILGGVLVAERNPKCLECYYHGHRGDICEYKACPLYQPENQ